MEYGLCPIQATVTGDEGLFPLEYGKLPSIMCSVIRHNLRNTRLPKDPSQKKLERLFHVLIKSLLSLTLHYETDRRFVRPKVIETALPAEQDSH